MDVVVIELFVRRGAKREFVKIDDEGCEIVDDEFVLAVDADDCDVYMGTRGLITSFNFEGSFSGLTLNMLKI